MSFWIDLLESIWGAIKRFFVKILNFAKNILDFFKDPRRLRKLKEDKNIIAVSIKQNLENGNYRTVNCFFDKKENEIVDMDDNALGIESEEIDAQTEKTFGNRDMVILA